MLSGSPANCWWRGDPLRLPAVGRCELLWDNHSLFRWIKLWPEVMSPQEPTIPLCVRNHHLPLMAHDLGFMWSLHYTEEASQTKTAAEPWNNERQIISATKQQVDFVKPRITSRGGANTNKATPFACCLFLRGIFPVLEFSREAVGMQLSAVVPGSSARWPLWSYTDFHERGGELQADPTHPHPGRKVGCFIGYR